MKKSRMTILVPVLMTAIFAIGFAGNKGYGEKKESVHKIKGYISEVNLKKDEILIKQNSRVLKFYAKKDLCEKYKSKINEYVSIVYTKDKDGKHWIKEIAEEKKPAPAKEVKKQP